MINLDKGFGRHFCFRQTFGALHLGKKRQLSCPVCTKPALRDHFPYNTRVQCPGCGAKLVVVPTDEWAHTFICIGVGFTIAHLQGLQNPLFFMCAVMYSGALVVIAAPLLGPLLALFFRPKLSVARDYIQTLEIPKR